ncbi:MAG: hypothetical protein WAK19_14565 [Candidatus Cybelea sp.]
MLHSSELSDGSRPDATLTNVGGTLYGSTWKGAANAGTVFSIRP